MINDFLKLFINQFRNFDGSPIVGLGPERIRFILTRHYTDFMRVIVRVRRARSL